LKIIYKLIRVRVPVVASAAGTVFFGGEGGSY